MRKQGKRAIVRKSDEVKNERQRESKGKVTAGEIERFSYKTMRKQGKRDSR